MFEILYFLFGVFFYVVFLFFDVYSGWVLVSFAFCWSRSGYLVVLVSFLFFIWWFVCRFLLLVGICLSIIVCLFVSVVGLRVCGSTSLLVGDGYI